jgi:cytochrome c-type biogenesis protein CcmH
MRDGQTTESCSCAQLGVIARRGVRTRSGSDGIMGLLKVFSAAERMGVRRSLVRSLSLRVLTRKFAASSALMMLMILGLLAFPTAGIAKEAQPNEDPQIEQRMKNLTEQLRCLVCQNETLADSHADLAEDLRKQVREQMKAGKSDKEIIAYLTDRYGDFVLYKPPVKTTTYLLWFGPFALLGGGTLVLYRYLSRRRKMIEERPLSAEERKQAAEILRSV